MQHEVGIRRGTGARFVLPGRHHRDPRSGLLRVFPVRAPQGQAMREAAASRPIHAIRLAARSTTRPTPVVAQRAPVLGTPGHTNWNPPRSRLRDPRGTATPWRG